MSKEWLYDEYKQTGTDYADLGKVAGYDAKMSKFRNYRKEAELILSILAVKPEDILLDIGTGTGHFARAAAGKCKKVYAIDVSQPMLDYARQKAKEEGLANIEWVNRGFLDFDFPGVKFDHIISNAVMHHLPDFWKQEALINVHKALKDGGKFLLGDVIFSGQPGEIKAKVEAWLNSVKNVDSELYAEGKTHIREEHSTFSWIIEGMLERVGFKYNMLRNENNHVVYLCVKK